ncbi:MAG: MazG nucleotide pyrophosphohydrolase domain protein [Bacteroidetes bacterium ADurb.Bin302]|nr:MAG: MazG nucleotide pyrophosphohydrolase domain protein [Bacteroidetes bacterium ADurb.Bin302]
MDNLTLNEVQKVVDKWISQFEEGYWPPLSMLAAVVEETGELAREINDLEGFKKKRMPDDTDIGMELADLIFSIVCIANYYHIDLSEAFKAILDKYTKRDMQRWTLKGKTQDEDTNNSIQNGN